MFSVSMRIIPGKDERLGHDVGIGVAAHDKELLFLVGLPDPVTWASTDFSASASLLLWEAHPNPAASGA